MLCCIALKPFPPLSDGRACVSWFRALQQGNVWAKWEKFLESLLQVFGSCCITAAVSLHVLELFFSMLPFTPWDLLEEGVPKCLCWCACVFLSLALFIAVIHLFLSLLSPVPRNSLTGVFHSSFAYSLIMLNTQYRNPQNTDNCYCKYTAHLQEHTILLFNHISSIHCCTPLLNVTCLHSATVIRMLQLWIIPLIRWQQTVFARSLRSTVWSK